MIKSYKDLSAPISTMCSPKIWIYLCLMIEQNGPLVPQKIKNLASSIVQKIDPTSCSSELHKSEGLPTPSFGTS